MKDEYSAPYGEGLNALDWLGYRDLVMDSIHVVCKKLTQRIKRNNLTLRTRLERLNRRTICFSRFEEIHDKVIGKCIAREHYQRI